MFDFHLHSSVSFDSSATAEEILSAAEQTGLREICFTDHYDYNDIPTERHDTFALHTYRAAYDTLSSETVKIRRGVEFGLTPWNTKEREALLASYPFDFVIGSVHFTGGYDPYYEEFWTHNGLDTAFEKYLLQTLSCVKAHEGFDVLGHINYVCKSAHCPTKAPLRYGDFPDLFDEIMKTVAGKGIGMEINTSGIDRVGDFLPDITYIRRFRELGGEIVTIGSDAHNGERVGQYTDRALAIAREVFGYVCTFEERRPIFHKL